MSHPKSDPTWLYLVRHGATEANERVPYILQGNALDLPLSAQGEREARALATFLKRLPVSRVYSSTMRRARQTAEAIGTSLGIEPLVAEDLHECDVGIWEGLDWGTIAREYPQEHRRFVDDPGNNPYMGGESYGQVLLRSRPAIERLLVAHQGESIVVVAHNVVNRGLLAGMLGLELRLAPTIPQGNGCVNLVKYTPPTPSVATEHQGGASAKRNGGCTLVTLNSLFHLDEGAAG